MPVEPPATAWQLTAAPADHPGELWAVGADLEPGTLLAAYRLGLFPMPLDGTIGWFSPTRRAVVPLAGHRPSRSVRRDAARFEIRIDTSFRQVISACARPGEPESWIDDAFVDAYCRLHDLGWCHSVEAWDDEGLAGGLYCVAIGGLVAAESMFYARSGASKATFGALVRHLQKAGDVEVRLLDVQWLTPHLASLGAVELTRVEYGTRLAAALALASPFEGEASLAPR